MKKDIGIILQGGGSKGAYQVGALLAISEIIKDYNNDENPFAYISGISVGAVNAASLATIGNGFNHGLLELKKKWLKLTNDDVYTLGRYGIFSSISNVFDAQNSLFDLSPLEEFLEREIDFSKIRDDKKLNIHAYSYDEGKNIIFNNNQMEISAKHIVASAAVPYIFNETIIDGKRYGDGGLSLRKPSNILIEEGCQNIIGMSLDIDNKSKTIADAIFSSIFPDSIKDDFKEIKLKNKLVNRFSIFNKIKHIETLIIKPEIKDFSISEKSIGSLSMSLRLASKVLRLNPEESGSILNYIIFDREYTEYLIDAGYNETLLKEEEILSFFGIKKNLI
jgi:NTE family protein